MAKQNKSSKVRGKSRARLSNRTPRSGSSINLSGSTRVAAPVATTFALSHPYAPQRIREVHDPVLGNGIRLSGREQWGFVFQTAAEAVPSKVFHIDTGMESVYGQDLGIEALPTQGGSMLKLMGVCWTMYRFTRVAFHYVPSCGSTTETLLTMAYIPDPGYAESGEQQPTQWGLQSMNHSVVCPAWQPCSLIVDNVPRTMPALYVDDSVSSGSSHRLSRQGYFCMLSSNSVSTNKDFGRIMLEYDVEFFQSGRVAAFTWPTLLPKFVRDCDEGKEHIEALRALSLKTTRPSNDSLNAINVQIINGFNNTDHKEPTACFLYGTQCASDGKVAVNLENEVHDGITGRLKVVSTSGLEDEKEGETLVVVPRPATALRAGSAMSALSPQPMFRHA